eukprot:COSAG06_NODE_17387_length_944_cov_1.172781_1_plen_252_part_10
MRFAPKSEKVGGGGGPSRKPPSRKGQFAKGPDGKQNERCICCKLEGASLPAGTGNCTQRGLQMLGHLDTKKDRAVKDLRFAPWNEREIEWIKKTETKKENAAKPGGKLNVNWPEGTGPMCSTCADVCRTLPCGKALVPWRYLESAWVQWRLQGDKEPPPFVYSCVAEDGSYVDADDERAKHGPVALPPGVPAGKGRNVVPMSTGREWDKPRPHWDKAVGSPYFKATAMALGMHPSDPNRRLPAASGGAAAAA